MLSIKKKLAEFDMFPAIPILRAEGETQVVNLCGGIFSILVFCAFIYIFISAIVNIVTLQSISAVEILQMDRPTNEPIGNITMAIGLQWMNMSALRNIFQIRAYLVRRGMAFTQIQVFPCTREMWKQLSDQKYKAVGLSTYMCIQREGIQIYGQFGEGDMQVLNFRVTQCNSTTSPVPCAPQAQVDYFFDNYLIWQRFFGCSLYMLDTRINANNENPLSYTVYQKTIWLLFNRDQFTMLQAFVGTYQITTDTNFFPWVVNDYKSGYYVTQAITIDFYNPNMTHPYFAQGFIIPSTINKVVNRTYGKIDDALSYVGGLFGIIISFFSFFLLSFNQYRYELRVSEGAFTFKEGHLAKQSQFHFLKFLKYVAYDWIKTIFCRQPDWDDCKAINEARQEAIEQIDIKHLLQRINHLQQVITMLVPQQNETVMYLAQSHSIQEVKRRRKIVDYCNKFTGTDQSLTIRNFQQINALYSFGISLVQNNNQYVYPGQDGSHLQINLNPPQLSKSKTSLQIMEQYIQKYKQKFNTQDYDFKMDEQELLVQKQVAQAFFTCNQSTRMQLIRKIPLGILCRLNIYKNNYLNIQNRKQKSQITAQHFLRPLRNSGKIKKRKLEHQNLDSTLQFKN